MKNMTVLGLFVLALAITPEFGKAAMPLETVASSQVHTGHLDWDKVDETWRCVGTPINCDFEDE